MKISGAHTTRAGLFRLQRRRATCVTQQAGGDKRPDAGGTGGFTLIELLVVIGVIGVLSALLLPPLSRAKAASRAAACRTNLGQIGRTLSLYLGENRHYPPLEETQWFEPGQGGGIITWADRLYPEREWTSEELDASRESLRRETM